MRPSSVVLLSFTALVAPALAQSPKALGRQLRAALAAVKSAPKTFAPVRAAIDGLAALDGAPAVEALLDAVEQVEKLAAPLLEKRRAGLLGEGGSGRLKRARYELRNLDDAAEAIAAALDGMTSADAVRAMLQRVTDRGAALPLWLRLRLAARAGELPREGFDWRPSADEKASDDTVLALLAATAALGARAGDSGSGAWVARQLAHANPAVRVAAARALGQLAWPGAIEPLVGLLDAGDDAVRDAAQRALMHLTGARPGDNAASWRAWLAAEGAPFLRGERPLGVGAPKAKKAKGEAKAATKAATFFGIEQAGAGILYVFDNSQSMQAKLGKQREGQPTTGDVATRWDLCRRELRSSLRALAPEQKFNLVSFANFARKFEEQLQPATPENVARAIAWLDGLSLEFETNVYDALDLAFTIAGRGALDRYYDSEVDTMFFLTDGAPTLANLDAGGIGPDDEDRILAAVRRWNALGRITIHTVGMNLNAYKEQRNDKGRLRPIWFLKLLAQQNGGTYKTARR